MKKAQIIRRMRQGGLSIDEICEKLSMIDTNDRKYVTSVCRKSGMPITDEEKTNSKHQQAKQFAHDEEWAKDYINEKSEGRFEYISGYVNMDSHVIVRCTYCGAEQDKSMISFRTSNYVKCSVCHFDERVDERKRERAEQKKKELERKQIEKDTSRLIRAGRGKQLSFGFCACGEMLTRFDGNKGKQCKDCARRAGNKYRELSRRIKLKNAMVDSDITIQKLFRRDNGVCYLCGGLCDWNDKEIIPDGTIVCGNAYPSIDHVIPLAKGGLHSWDNVRLAHRICNSLKADKTA